MSGHDTSESDKQDPRPELSRRATTGELKFKHTSSNLSNFAFSTNQIWVNRSNQEKILFIDQAEGSGEENRRRAQDRKRRRVLNKRAAPINQILSASPIHESHIQHPPTLDLRQGEHQTFSPILSPSTPYSLPSRNIHGVYSSPTNLDQTPSVSALISTEHPWAAEDFEQQTQSSPGIKGNYWYPTRHGPASNQSSPLNSFTPGNLYKWPSQFTAIESATLMRVHMDLLSKWADAGYPTRHFNVTLHEHAQTFPPLLQAMLTSAATHLLNTPAHRTSDGIIQYQGVLLPALTKEAVIRCHNGCIADLLRYCDQNAGIHDDNVLAALTMLRYHEELLSYADEGRDTGRLFRIFNTFVTARNLHGTPRSQDATPSTSREHSLAYFKSLRHAIHRLALRQELTSAYIEQVKLNINLEPWMPLDEVHEEDIDSSIWADRCLLQCAKTINLCFDNNRINFSYEWNELKREEATLESVCPDSCNPLLWQQLDHKVFPLIWYDSLCPITGMQWLGLSKLLLMVHNPNLPRIGPDVLLAQQRLAEESRSIIRTICGIADSDRSAQPAYVQAQMAIMAGGAYFTDQANQDAMLAILAHLEYEFGWPTSSNVTKLKTIWNRNL